MASAAKSPVSPSSSPRLPSPPPFPEVQIGPKSNAICEPNASNTNNVEKLSLESGSTRRIRPGTKASDMSSGPPLVPLAELDSPFQLQEHLKALYLDATRSENNHVTLPITRETATMLATPPENIERSLWLYELCRFLVQKANSLIVGFFSDAPPCSAKNCPEMRASEWQYLCAVHDPPRSCCAIDYCCHTLDWAANVLTSQKHYPSRLTLGNEGTGGGPASVRQLTNIFRRVYRMFAHAWFSHRDVFWALENQEGMYIFYKTVCDMYQLIPEENYTVPPEAEGVVSLQEAAPWKSQEPPRDIPAAPKKDAVAEQRNNPSAPADVPAQTTISTGATTRRHKNTPSSGSFVTSIAEGDEERDNRIGPDQAIEGTTAPNTIRHDPSHSPPKRLESIHKEDAPEKLENKEAQQVHVEDHATVTLTDKLDNLKLEKSDALNEETEQEGKGDEKEEPSVQQPDSIHEKEDDDKRDSV